MDRNVFNATKFLLFLTFIALIIPNIVFAKSYFIKSDGNDNFDGLSDATAWKTIKKINNFSFKTGDDVYFKCGNIFSGSGNGLEIDWTGTSINRVVIGAYYLEDGEEKVGLSGKKPVIDGENSADDDWAGLFKVTKGDNDYITIENIRLINSGGKGIAYHYSNYGIVRNVEIDRTYRQGVTFFYSDDCILKDSDITDIARCLNGAAVIAQYSNRTIISGNVIHEIGGKLPGTGREGINLWLSKNSIVSNNIIYDCRGMGIYLEHTINATVEFNLIYYTGNKDYWRHTNKSAAGIVFNDEWVPSDVRRMFDHTAYGNVVHRNIIVNAGKGIDLWSGDKNEIDPGLIDVQITENLIVEPYSTDGSHRAISLAYSERNSNSIIKRNIFFQSEGIIANISGVSGITFENNLWSKEPDIDAISSSDPPFSKPEFIKDRPSGWRTISPGSLKYSDFSLKKDSIGFSLINSALPYSLAKIKNFRISPKLN